jgi:GNAT superfamily N-acetyltransferase
MSLRIDPATPHDVPLLAQMVRELAEFEQLSDQVSATEADLREHLFGPNAVPEVLVARWEGEAAGYALFFKTFSTFLAKPGIYLEDVFVRPRFRNRGIGGAFLQRIARLAVERGYGRVEWAVLNWNGEAIRFYERLGAVPLEEWRTYRLSGEALSNLAEPAP